MAYLALLFGTRFFSRIGLYRTRSSYYARYSSCLMRLTTALGEVLLEPAERSERNGVAYGGLLEEQRSVNTRRLMLGWDSTSSPVGQ